MSAPPNVPPQQQGQLVQAVRLAATGYALIQAGLDFNIDLPTQTVTISIGALMGRESALVLGAPPVKIKVRELARVTFEELVALAKAAEAPREEQTPC